MQTGGFTVLRKPQPSNFLPFLNPCNMYLNSAPENVDYLSPSTFHLALKCTLVTRKLILQNQFLGTRSTLHFLLHDLATKMFPMGYAKRQAAATQLSSKEHGNLLVKSLLTRQVYTFFIKHL